MTGGHTRQCSAKIVVDSQALADREKRKKDLDEAKAKLPKVDLKK